MKKALWLCLIVCMCVTLLHPAPGRQITAEFKYNFTVRNKTSKIRFICVIPQTLKNRQTVEEIRYSIEPTSTYVKDGTEYAEFIILSPKKSFILTIDVDMELYRNDLATVKANRSFTPMDHEGQYLSSEKFIESDSDAIAEAADNIPTGKTREKTVKSIFDHVIDLMSYGGYYPDDQGALHACNTGDGDCTEYADLFVALCRAKGIPARTHEGYTISWSNTPKHVWAEVFFDEYGWVSFDPTFVDTGEGAFDIMSNVYVYLSAVRNDQTLTNYHFWLYYYWGNKISVTDTFEIKDR